MSESGDERWGDRLRKRARELGMTDTQVAERLGMTQRRYSSYVNMTREPRFDDLVRICAALATSADYVLGLRGPEPSDDLRRRVLGALDRMPARRRELAAVTVEALAQGSIMSGRPSADSSTTSGGESGAKQKGQAAARSRGRLEGR